MSNKLDRERARPSYRERERPVAGSDFRSSFAADGRRPSRRGFLQMEEDLRRRRPRPTEHSRQIRFGCGYFWDVF